MGVFESILITIITASTPLLLASIGELVTERAGVLNLGVEGMMVMGAVVAFATSKIVVSPYVMEMFDPSYREFVGASAPYAGIVAGVIAGVLMSLLFGFLTLTLVANQVATGLALTILGLGLSGLIGESFVGQPGTKMEALFPETLQSIPFVGPVLLGQDLIFYISIALIIGVNYFMFRTRAGLVVRSVGDSHVSAHALGINVIGIRYLAVMFGGACSGLAGAYLSLVYTPQWVENMTAGRGWIALALVVFASWRPYRLLIGGYLFGAISIIQLHVQAGGAWMLVYGLKLCASLVVIWVCTLALRAFGVRVDRRIPLAAAGIAAMGTYFTDLESIAFIPPAQFLSALPYVATVVVLVIISQNRRLTLLNTPASLGKSFVPDR